MVISRVRDNNTFSNMKYLMYFVTRSFLISVLVMIMLFAVLIGCYLVDLSINVESGNAKNPLFGAYVIVSPSMVPTININDTIVIKRMDKDRYNIGDIITFASNDVSYRGEAITHRIVDKESVKNKSSIYTTKGDNNPVVDRSFVTTNSIYGRVLFKIPKLGYVQNFFGKPINFFLGILIPAVVVLIYDSFRILKMMKKRS